MTTIYIEIIKKLIQSYFNMENGEQIEHQTELLQIHPEYPLFISRRSLKHFVENRKKELVGKYDTDHILNRLFFIIDNVIETFNSHDNIVIQANSRIVYSKKPLNHPQYSIRIVVDKIDSRLEICSIHLQKSKKLPQG